jgi:hypothetical protein
MSLKFLKDRAIEQAQLLNQTMIPEVPQAFHLDPNATTHLSDCNIRCAKEECGDFKSDLPFEVTLACTRKRCNCYLELDEPVFEQYLGE